MTPEEKETYESRKRVAEWRAFISPKLRQLDEQEFDIHEYGSRIMDDMEINESRPFADFVDGKSSSEVVRYFVSALQLANTLNVEICGAKPGELSNDTMELKLLSKDRYHEHLRDYQAPSEEGLKEKLLKIKQIRQQNKVNCITLAGLMVFNFFYLRVDFEAEECNEKFKWDENFQVNKESETHENFFVSVQAGRE